MNALAEPAVGRYLRLPACGLRLIDLSHSATFGDRLRALREAAGLSIYELAKRAGLSRTAVSRIEQDERQPSYETAVKLARALGVSVAAFDDPPADSPQPTEPARPADSSP